LKEKAQKDTLTRYRLFKAAVSKPGALHLIAELKKASPSKGVIREQFDVMQLAQTYAESGASAFSIVTEDKFFLGKTSYVKQVSEHFPLPVLLKDFIVDEVQVYEAFYVGASAILLIVAILDDAQLRHLIGVASRLDLDCVVEVHNEQELKRALAADAEIIGINNRNLRTFEVDISVSERIIPTIPKDKVVIAESGITTYSDIQRVRDAGAHAVLIGETFLRADDVSKKIKEVFYGTG